MGQRLVVNIIANDDILASAYYHWSAYTESAAEITKQIVENVIKNNQKAVMLLSYTENSTNTDAINKLTAYLMLEDTDAGLYHADNDLEIEEYKKIGAAYNYRVGENRSVGLIALTPKKIKDFNYYAEGTVNIDISNDIVKFDVFGIFLEDEIDEDEEKIELKFDDVDEFSFDKVDTWFDQIKEMCNNDEYPYYKDKNEPIYYQVIA